jgi:large subunit ribosomal protein L10
MAKSKVQKSEILRDLTDKAGRAKSIVFTGFNGLGVKESEELRKGLRAENGEYCVTKKTLLNLVFKNSKMEDGLNARTFSGQIAAIFGYGDEVSPARVIAKFIKGHEKKLYFIGGFLEHKFLSADQMGELAKLPGKQELYAQVVGTLNAPISGFVNALAGNLRNMVYVLKAIGEKKAGNN